jgi:hypothetical protein
MPVEKPPQAPQIADTVHYIDDDGGPCQAAIVTELPRVHEPQIVSLHVFGQPPRRGADEIPYGEPGMKEGRTWHWRDHMPH